MTMPVPFGPNELIRVPSGRMLIFETFVQVPTSSRAVCATALLAERVAAKHGSANGDQCKHRTSLIHCVFSLAMGDCAHAKRTCAIAWSIDSRVCFLDGT